MGHDSSPYPDVSKLQPDDSGPSKPQRKYEKVLRELQTELCSVQVGSRPWCGRPQSMRSSRGDDKSAMQTRPLTRANLRTPKAAAIAGMVFSLLLIAVFWLLRTSISADPQEPGAWLQSNSDSVALALNLMPFAGIAFLWFIGVLRDRLGPMEDQFFATVFFGSGLLFLAMLFAAAAIVGAILVAFATQPEDLIGSATFHFARAAAYNLVNVYMIKMASVFMITTSVVAIYTGIAPRWLAFVGLGLALLLLFGSFYISWSFLVFPLWVFLLSASILRDSVRRQSDSPEPEKG